MLKLRLLTAFVLGPLVIWGIFALPTHWFGVMFGVFAVVGAWEWARLVRLDQSVLRALYAALLIPVLWFCSDWVLQAENILYVTGIAIAWWLHGTVMVFRYHGEQAFNPGAFDVLSGYVLLISCWAGLVWLHGHENGAQLVLFMMLSIWAADSGAYFAGRKFGKRKLAPRVSPGKSWEGVFGGFILAMLFAVLSSLYWFEWQGMFAAGFVLLTMLTVMISVIGDLAESVFKRRVGVKDSGSILPGHGGVLDRIDSLTAAAPLFAAGFWILENML